MNYLAIMHKNQHKKTLYICCFNTINVFSFCVLILRWILIHLTP